MTTSLTDKPKRKEICTMVYKFEMYFSEKKLPYFENLRIKSLGYFGHHHINLFLVILSYEGIMH